MAYFESTKLKDNAGNNINPAEDDSLTLLRSIFKLLKPLGFITGSGSNRLNVDVNSVVNPVSVSSLPTLSNVTTVSTVSSVSTVTNISTIGNHNAFDLMKSMSRTAYNTGIRSNLI